MTLRPWHLALLSVFILSSCEDLGEWAPPPGQHILFEVEYVNFAWGYNDHGAYIDNQGNVYAYDFKGTGDVWQPRNAYSEQDLQAKFSHGRRFLRAVDPSVIRSMCSRVPTATQAPSSDTLGIGADMGVTTYSAYLFDPQTAVYRPVALRANGDWSFERLSDDAKAIADWLKAVAF